MAFISKSNASRIIKAIDFKSVSNFSGKIYKLEIEVLNQQDKNRLLALSEFYSDPQKFLESKYNRIQNIDTLSYIFEGGQPAYHSKPECPKLNTTFYNFKIPQEIRDKGEPEVGRFRNWFKANKHLLDKPESFEVKMMANFSVRQTLKQIEHIPSGAEEVENLDLNSLEEKIDALLLRISAYYSNADDKTKNVINNFKKNTFLAYSNHEIKDRQGFTDRALKDFLKKYDEEFKKPLQKLLKEYYRVKSNPLLSFEGNILEQLGLRPCSVCYEV